MHQSWPDLFTRKLYRWPRRWGVWWALLLLTGCATARSLRAVNTRSNPSIVESRWSEGVSPAIQDAAHPSAQDDSPARRRHHVRAGEKADPLKDWEEGGMGWRDGVGDGAPFSVPLSLDWFQGFLVQAGVSPGLLPGDGRTLAPEQALELLPHLLASPVTLGNFGPKRMAAHLLLGVATGGRVVEREELHERMRHYAQLLVLRPDGYLVKATTGRALQKVGPVGIAEDGALCVGRFEVGPFYTARGKFLFPVDDTLEVPQNAVAVGFYEPDDGVLMPVMEGAALALVDTVEGLYRLLFHTGETLEGLARLPGAAGELWRNAPEHWEAFRHKPHAERVRTISRLTASVVLVVGSSGAGAVKVANWGGKLGHLAVPLFSVTGEGALALRLVAMPVGQAVAVTGQALSATYVLHMAATGMSGWKPPEGGPGQWVQETEHMSETSRRYQSQVTGSPEGWVYRVRKNGKEVDFDGYQEGHLLDAKGFNYDKWFDANLKHKQFYQGAQKLVDDAIRQLTVAKGTPIRWHVAEPRMVQIIQKLFQEKGIEGIDVVYTPFVPVP